MKRVGTITLPQHQEAEVVHTGNSSGGIDSLYPTGASTGPHFGPTLQKCDVTMQTTYSSYDVSPVSGSPRTDSPSGLTSSATPRINDTWAGPTCASASTQITSTNSDSAGGDVRDLSTAPTGVRESGLRRKTPDSAGVSDLDNSCCSRSQCSVPSIEGRKRFRTVVPRRVFIDTSPSHFPEENDSFAPRNVNNETMSSCQRSLFVSFEEAIGPVD